MKSGIEALLRPDDGGMMSIRGMNVSHKIMVLAVGLVLAGVHDALAQQKSPAINIAVVDIQLLMENSAAAQNVRAQIEKIRAKYQQEVKDKEDEISKLSQSIAQERPRLSEDDYQKRMRELRQKSANYQSDMQERQGKMDGAFRGASQKIAASIAQTVDEITKEQKLILVLPRSTVVGTPTVPDITQEVLKRLNQQTPTLTVDLPK